MERGKPGCKPLSAHSLEHCLKLKRNLMKILISHVATIKLPMKCKVVTYVVLKIDVCLGVCRGHVALSYYKRSQVIFP